MTSYLPLITGSGGALVTLAIGLYLFATDRVISKGTYEQMRDDRDDWKHIAETERARADAGVVTGQIVRDVMLGLRKELD